MPNEPALIDGEVISETPTNDAADVAPADYSSGADTLLTITNLIQNYIASIDRDEKELSANKQMLDDAFMNDVVYKEHADKAKEAAKIKSQTKMQILKQPQLIQLSTKVKELAQHLKETKASLSDYLQEYARLTGSTTIESADGELQEIIYTAKLVKTSSKRD